MTDEEIAEALRTHATKRTPVETAELLAQLAAGRLTQGSLIMHFTQRLHAELLRG
jgi:hypothetical protein